MAANVDAIIQEGIAAIKAGRKDDAKRALMKAVDLDERSEQAWLWLSACVESVEEQQICLENVLSINPANQKAQKGLDAIKKMTGGQKPGKPAAPSAPSVPSVPSAPASPASSPFDNNASSDFDSNPFAGTGFDSNPYSSNRSDPAVRSGWGGFDSTPEPPTTASSVDWNRGSGAAAYGSGRDVQLPSADEYDNWVSGLQLGGSSGAFDSSAPFGQTGSPFASTFDDSADPFGGSSPAAPDPFGASSSSAFDTPSPRGGSASSPFGDFGSPAPSFDSGPAYDNDPFGSSSSDDGPFGGSSSFGDADAFASPESFGTPAPASSSMRGDPFAVSSSFDGPFSGPSEPTFNNDPVADLFSAVPGAGVAKGKSSTLTPPPGPAPKAAPASNPFGSSQSSVFGGAPDVLDDLPSPAASTDTAGFAFIDSGSSGAPAMQAYFRAIPAEIQAPKAKPSGGGTSVGLVLTVGALTILNMVSLAALVLNLMRR